MVNYKFINTFSTVVSIIVYLFFLILAIYVYRGDFARSKPETFNPEKAVIVDLKDIKEEKITKKLSKNLIKISQNKEKESTKDSRDKVQNNIKNLFSTMDVDKDANEIEQKLKQEKTRSSRLKKLNAKELFKSQNLDDGKLKKELKKLKKSIKKKQKKATKEQQKYIDKVGGRLQTKWQDTIETKDGLKSKVVITIDKNGRFFYRILTKSFNNLFDSKLKQFLDNLSNQKFPKFKKGRGIEFLVTFEDKEEF